MPSSKWNFSRLLSLLMLNEASSLRSANSGIVSFEYKEAVYNILNNVLCIFLCAVFFFENVHMYSVEKAIFRQFECILRS